MGEVIVVMNIAEAEVRDLEGVIRIFEGNNRVVGAARRIVDRGYVDGQGANGWIGIDAAVQGAAVILDAEAEGRIVSAVGIGDRAEHQVTGSDVGYRDSISCGYGNIN